jgi:hypothetical protein
MAGVVRKWLVAGLVGWSLSASVAHAACAPHFQTPPRQAAVPRSTTLLQPRSFAGLRATDAPALPWAEFSEGEEGFFDGLSIAATTFRAEHEALIESAHSLVPRRPTLVSQHVQLQV